MSDSLDEKASVGGAVTRRVFSLLSLVKEGQVSLQPRDARGSVSAGPHVEFENEKFGHI